MRKTSNLRYPKGKQRAGTAPINKPLTLCDKVGYGKYKERTLEWLLVNDFSYLKWLLTVHRGSVSFSKWSGTLIRKQRMFINRVSEIYW